MAYHRTPKTHPVKKPCPSGLSPSSLHSSASKSGTAPNHAKLVRHTGNGPARGKHRFNSAAERTASPRRAWLVLIVRIGGSCESESTIAGAAPCVTRRYSCLLAPSRYTPFMPFILFGMRLLEVIFFIGLAGSAIVILLTSFEDMHELFSKTKHP